VIPCSSLSENWIQTPRERRAAATKRAVVAENRAVRHGRFILGLSGLLGESSPTDIEWRLGGPGGAPPEQRAARGSQRRRRRAGG
jgi:hypothetical protein